MREGEREEGGHVEQMQWISIGAFEFRPAVAAIITLLNVRIPFLAFGF